ncbi:LOG family protein YvdD [mine drainage metagenome]|uniref:LOG family protein YvdD n=1 Tax=mine drainage metagenome TaxID=410659 RepID=A0A1J5SCB5_9ZZZZ
MKSLCVFCGSSPGADPAFAAAARALGRQLAERGLGLVYGGGRVGLMGQVADACLTAGGTVTGIIPRHLHDKEVGHHGLSTLHVVDSMHARKAMMARLADGFLVLPGGIGTLEEFFEIWTWGQLGLHGKPFGVLNIQGYYDGLFTFLDNMTGQGFLRATHRAMVRVNDDIPALLDALAAWRAAPQEKWLDPSET